MSADSFQILLVDDNEQGRHDLQTILEFLGEATIAASSSNWISLMQQQAVDPATVVVAIVGQCQHQSLLQLLRDIHQWEAGIPFIIIGDQDVSDMLDSELLNQITAVLPTELSYQPLLDALHKARVFHEHYNRLRDFGGVRDYNMFRSLVGNSPAIQRIRHMMGRVADSEVSVLITGESGTGKEVVARNLHQNSARVNAPFIPINCGAIPRELLESELFGHEKGAFTGAVASRAGRFELADGGTLFLDEIGDMPLNMQVKLLRVIQEGSFERVGGVTTLQSDVRIIAATHRNLEQMIEQGEFRQDLYYRLNVFPIEMPSLRARRDDVPMLLNELIGVMEAEGRGSVRFNSGAIAALCRYDWPGNVRELANLVERMAILYPHGIVGARDLPEKIQQIQRDKVEASTATSSGVVNLQSRLATQEQIAQSLLPLKGLDLKEYLANLERNLIAQALADSKGVVSRAADRLQIGRTTLVEKMRKYEMGREMGKEAGKGMGKD